MGPSSDPQSAKATRLTEFTARPTPGKTDTRPVRLTMRPRHHGASAQPDRQRHQHHPGARRRQAAHGFEINRQKADHRYQRAAVAGRDGGAAPDGGLAQQAERDERRGRALFVTDQQHECDDADPQHAGGERQDRQAGALEALQRQERRGDEEREQEQAAGIGAPRQALLRGAAAAGSRRASASSAVGTLTRKTARQPKCSARESPGDRGRTSWR